MQKTFSNAYMWKRISPKFVLNSLIGNISAVSQRPDLRLFQSIMTQFMDAYIRHQALIYKTFTYHITAHRFCAILQYLQSVSNGYIAALHWIIHIFCTLHIRDPSLIITEHICVHQQAQYWLQNCSRPLLVWATTPRLDTFIKHDSQGISKLRGVLKFAIFYCKDSWNEGIAKKEEQSGVNTVHEKAWSVHCWPLVRDIFYFGHCLAHISRVSCQKGPICHA